jgi:hypothetical protein
MKRRIALAVAASISGGLCSCGQRAETSLGEDESGTAQPALATGAVGGIMREKVMITQGLVVAVSRADFERVQDGAADLYRIGQAAEWMVHDTVTYIVFSERFRQVAATMAQDAQRQDLEAVTDDYAQLMNSCVECHSYLRRERLIKDFPERTSMIEPAEPIGRREES